METLDGHPDEVVEPKLTFLEALSIMAALQISTKGTTTEGDAINHSAWEKMRDEVNRRASEHPDLMKRCEAMLAVQKQLKEQDEHD